MFHKEGYQIILTSFLIAALIAIGSEYKIDNFILRTVFQIFSLLQLILVLQFFRNPKREIILNKNHLIAPVDGKVVIIKKVREKEYFKDDRLQISIFMSPLNVHVTRYTMSGIVKFSKYQRGIYQKLIPLGGINSKNLNKLKTIDCEGFALMSEIKKKPAISNRLF